MIGRSVVRREGGSGTVVLLRNSFVAVSAEEDVTRETRGEENDWLGTDVCCR